MQKFFIGLILTLVGLGLLTTLARTKYSDYQALSAEIASYDNALDQASELKDLQEK